MNRIRRSNTASRRFEAGLHGALLGGQQPTKQIRRLASIMAVGDLVVGDPVAIDLYDEVPSHTQFSNLDKFRFGAGAINFRRF